MSLDRRTFLTGSVASAMVAPSLLQAKSGTKYRTALIGCGWWGMNIAREAVQSGQCKFVGMCDVDQRHLDKNAAGIETLSGDQPRKY